MKRILTIGIILLFIGMSISSSTGFNVREQSIKPLNGKTLYVGGSGPGNYTKIQDAIDNASDGDTVYVYDDSSPYYENLIVNKSVTLTGENKDTTIIDGGGIKDVVYVSADEVYISGFTIQNSGCGTYPYYAGIGIFSISNTITGNIISSNQGDGIYLNFSNNNIITGNTIVNNEKDGIRLRGSDNNIITSNTIQDHHWNFGIGFYYSNSNTIIDNNIRNNAVGLLLWGHRNTVTGNIIISNLAADIWARFTKSSTIKGNIVSSNNWYGLFFERENTGNTITDNTISNHYEGIYLNWDSHRNTIRGNIISNNLLGINISSSFNVILKNNFLNNERHAFFSGFIAVTLKINLSKDERRVFFRVTRISGKLRYYLGASHSLGKFRLVTSKKSI